MSQVYDDIKKEYSDYQRQLDKEREIKARLLVKELDEDRKLLEASGVRQIFEEIRDNGLVKLRPKKIFKLGKFSKLFGKKTVEEKDYAPARIVDNGIYISLQFDERSDGYSEVRIAAINGVVNVGHGYNRVDYKAVENGKIKEAVIDGLKNPLRIGRGY
jgi:hypothetical protein